MSETPCDRHSAGAAALRRRCRGVAMLEFLVALLVFSAGLGGLLSVQLATASAAYEAQQRSQAVALARDILARIQANRGQADAYHIAPAGRAGNRLATPARDCHAMPCSPLQLARFDLWQWEGLLLGAAERSAGNSVGGVLAPRACITRSASIVTVAVSWRGLNPSPQSTTGGCGTGEPGLYDAPGEPPGNQLLRRQLALSLFVGPAP